MKEYGGAGHRQVLDFLGTATVHKRMWHVSSKCGFMTGKNTLLKSHRRLQRHDIEESIVWMSARRDISLSDKPTVVHTDKTATQPMPDHHMRRSEQGNTRPVT
jgi:hypothetical protein